MRTRHHLTISVLTVALSIGAGACSERQLRDVPDAGDPSTDVVESPPAQEVELPDGGATPGEAPADDELGSEDGEG